MLIGRHYIPIFIALFLYCFSFVYRRIFVADGNFKADHVRQKDRDGDIWLLDGAGMMPNRKEYSTFLKSAKERSTVSADPDPNANANADADY